MSFLNDNQIDEINGKLVSNETELKQIYRAKKNKYQILTIIHSLVDSYLSKGWEIEKEFKTKTRIKKEKIHSIQFEDDIWCQFYELGYRNLNRDETFYLPFNKDIEDKKQIDIIAINKETIFLIECKSSYKLKKAPSYKDEFDLLRLRLDGFRKALHQLYGKDIKIKFIFATRNLRLDIESEDMKRLEKARAFYYNDNTYSYINNLIKHYKNASIYQFLGLIFKNELINKNKIEIPVVQGWMGKKKYYMFSIEPDLLLKIGFILHRTKANEVEFPTYQRLLVPSRLKGITKFIDDGGYFPNSIIINFNEQKNKIIFEPALSKGDSKSNIGILKIPNAYAIAYIIDGQHRLYGYANSEYLESNTIPVVGLIGLEADEQLSIFMDINQNQKAVSPSLKLDLEEYIHWDSDRADSRLKALRSSIIKHLSNSNGALFNKISIGEDTSILSSAPFEKALVKSGLLPSAKGNEYIPNTVKASLYNTYNNEHTQEMQKSRTKIVKLVNACYDLVEENFPDIFERDKYFIMSNRGTFAFITLIGSINVFLTNKGELSYSSSSHDRYQKIEKYLYALLEGINRLSEEKEKEQLSLLGAGADIKWLRLFQSLINESFSEYEPVELIDWKERQDDELQNKGRTYGIEIEKFMKKFILSNLEKLYSTKWDLEIGKIKRDCVSRALEEDEKNHKEGLNKESSDWKEMFTITDYKTIIEKHWTKLQENINEFTTFEQEFSIDINMGFNSKSEKLKWISVFNSHRNLWAHEGSKEKRLNRDEVEFLEKIYLHFYKK